MIINIEGQLIQGEQNDIVLHLESLIHKHHNCLALTREIRAHNPHMRLTRIIELARICGIKVNLSNVGQSHIFYFRPTYHITILKQMISLLSNYGEAENLTSRAAYAIVRRKERLTDIVLKTLKINRGENPIKKQNE